MMGKWVSPSLTTGGLNQSSYLLVKRRVPNRTDPILGSSGSAIGELDDQEGAVDTIAGFDIHDIR